jgi:hypothetical protein
VLRTSLVVLLKPGEAAMRMPVSTRGWLGLAVATSALTTAGCGGYRSSPGPDDPKAPAAVPGRTLSHEETLRWVDEHKAWRLARKTRPIWARQVAPEEVNREFQTADRVKEVAREGYWLCVGVAGEPWFQSKDKLEGKYEPKGEELKTFAFDAEPHTYRLYVPKASVRNWVAQVKGAGIEGFYVRPGYDPERPLYSPAGGFVVRDEVADPYREAPQDVWLVQEPLFLSTYEFVAGPSRE